MRLFLLLLLTGIVGSSVSGAAPLDDPAGRIYYEFGSSLRARHSTALMLKSDGTYDVIFSWIHHPPGLPWLTSGTGGKWRYTITGSDEATLALADQDYTTELYFVGDDFGRIAQPLGTGEFRFNTTSMNLPLLNASNRCHLAPGEKALNGFVIGGQSTRALLIRAIGPGLKAFGMPDTIETPRLTITDATGAVLATGDAWFENRSPNSDVVPAIRATSALVGAFPLTENSKDSAVIVCLPPGAYVAQVDSPATNDSGEVLCEVYMLP